MATLTAYNGFRLDFAAPDSATTFDPQHNPTVKPTYVQFRDGTSTFTITGTGISFNPTTGAASGVGTGFKFIEGSVTKAVGTGFNVSAKDALVALNTGNYASFISKAFNGNDTIKGHSANDTIYGFAGNDKIYGGGGNDYLRGDAGNDTLSGDAGNDTLYGGAGYDTLSGGTGKDKFVFKSAAEIGKAKAAHDTITDFKKTDGDKIDLSAIDAKSKSITKLEGANDAFKFLTKDGAAFTKKAGELRFDTQGTGSNKITIVEGDINGDGKADFHLELTGHIKLAATDFIL